MKTLVMGLVLMVILSSCARPIIDANYQRTQPLLTQMLCPMCEVPSLNPVAAKAPPAAPSAVESTTVSTVENPPAPSAVPDAEPAPVEVSPVPSGASPSKRVITLDLNAPDLGIPSQTVPVPPQSRTDLFSPFSYQVTAQVRSPVVVVN